jgi:hypothetical protein
MRGTNSLAARSYWRYKAVMSTKISAKKSNKGRPSVDSEAINVRMERPQIESVDDWRRQQKDLPTRPEAVRRLVGLGLGAAGALFIDKNGEGSGVRLKRPTQLDASLPSHDIADGNGAVKKPRQDK